MEEECTKLEMIYNKINKNGFEKSKKFREEKDLLVPEEIRLEEFVGVKQNHVSYKSLKNDFYFFSILKLRWLGKLFLHTLL